MGEDTGTLSGETTTDRLELEDRSHPVPVAL